MKPLSRPFHSGLLATFAILMIATRYHHFGDVLHLPDASMAIFFLGGLYLRGHLPFLGLLGLAVGIDWAAVELAGVSDFCVTPAYAFLLPAYAVLWYGGRAYAPRMAQDWRGLCGALLVALACASLSFLISNGAFYWLGGRYPNPEWSQYLARIWQWGPLFVRTTLTYVASALLVHGLLLATRRRPASLGT
ncbi:hypothetical protein LAG73_07100 [Pseudoxanthomonas japonensis]|nr:hypothetical protein LAG73_07100 [Pseudoxanthomonas japonensis]